MSTIPCFYEMHVLGGAIRCEPGESKKQNEILNLNSPFYRLFPPASFFKVIRTKHEDKARGFGFVSFMDPMDCAKAIREMQGKYLGTRYNRCTKK